MKEEEDKHVTYLSQEEIYFTTALYMRVSIYECTTNLRYYLVHNVGISSGALFLPLRDGGLQVSSILFFIRHLPTVINMCTMNEPVEECETLL